MIKRFAVVFTFMIFLSCIFFAQTTYAVTEKQKEIGQLIANFAVDVSTKHEDDFGYSFYFGKDGKKMESSMEHRKKANELGRPVKFLQSPQTDKEAEARETLIYSEKETKKAVGKYN